MQEDARPYWTEEDTEAKKLWAEKEEREFAREDRDRLKQLRRESFKKKGWQSK